MGYLKLRFAASKGAAIFWVFLEGQNRAFFHKLLALPKLKITTKKKSNFHRHFKTCVQIACKFSVFPWKKELRHFVTPWFSTVGAKGFEPSTPCSQSRCASRTAPYPEKKDDVASSSFFRGEGGIRTPGTHCWIRQFSKLLVSATHPPLLGCELRLQK